MRQWAISTFLTGIIMCANLWVLYKEGAICQFSCGISHPGRNNHKGACFFAHIPPGSIKVDDNYSAFLYFTKGACSHTLGCIDFHQLLQHLGESWKKVLVFSIGENYFKKLCVNQIGLVRGCVKLKQFKVYVVFKSTVPSMGAGWSLKSPASNCKNKAIVESWRGEKQN